MFVHVYVDGGHVGEILFQEAISLDYQVLVRVSFDGSATEGECIFFFTLQKSNFQGILQVDGVEDGFQVEDIIEIIKAILSVVFGFVQDDQDWNDEPATEA